MSTLHFEAICCGDIAVLKHYYLMTCDRDSAFSWTRDYGGPKTCVVHPHEKCRADVWPAAYHSRYLAWLRSCSRADAKILSTRQCAARFYYKLYAPSILLVRLHAESNKKKDAVVYTVDSNDVFSMSVNDQRMESVLNDVARDCVLFLATQHRYLEAATGMVYTGRRATTGVHVKFEVRGTRDDTTTTEVRSYGCDDTPLMVTEQSHRVMLMEMLRQAQLAYARIDNVDATVVAVAFEITWNDA